MFKNPNYEWLLDFELPKDAFFGGFYYMYLYNKLFSQGRSEDRYRLEELYDERKNHAPFPFNILTSFVCFKEEYYNTVNDFIYEKQMEHYDDEQERERLARMDEINRKTKEIARKASVQAYGYDRKEAEKEAVLVEMKLNASHTAEQDEVERDPYDAFIVTKYACGEYIKNNVKVLKKEDIIIEDRYGKHKVIHTMLFDKFKGFYNFAMYCDDEIDMFTGKPLIHQGWAKTYADTHPKIWNSKWNCYEETRVRGIESMYREFLDEYKDFAKDDHYFYYRGLAFEGITNTYEYAEKKNEYLKMVEEVKKEEETRIEKERRNAIKAKIAESMNFNSSIGTKTTRTTTKAKKEPKVDISKINKALGLESCDDELNGNIF